MTTFKGICELLKHVDSRWNEIWYLREALVDTYWIAFALGY